MTPEVAADRFVKRSAPGRRRLRLVPPSEPIPSAMMLAALGHELRTPLAALRASLEVLAEGPIPDAEATSLLIGRVERSLGWLEGLVENLSTWALIERGTVRLVCGWHAVDETVERAVAIAQPLLDRKRQIIRVSCPDPAPVAFIDPLRLGQVLVNLLTNAGRYSPDDTVVEVTVVAGVDGVEFRVKDQGPGIPPRDRERIFEPYVRGRRAHQHSSLGLGLGLHIVRELVCLHGGEVGVESVSADGSTFWLRIPHPTP